MATLDPQWVPPRKLARQLQLPSDWSERRFGSTSIFINLQSQQTTFVDPRFNGILPNELQTEAFPPRWELDFDEDDEPFFINHRKQETVRRPAWLTEEQHQALNRHYLKLYSHRQQQLFPELSLAQSFDHTNDNGVPPPLYEVYMRQRGMELESEDERWDNTLASPDTRSEKSDVSLRDLNLEAHLSSDEDTAGTGLQIGGYVEDWTPSGWAKVEKDSCVYFVHEKTKRVSWTDPELLLEEYGLRLEELPSSIDVTVDEYGLVFHDHSKQSASRSSVFSRDSGYRASPDSWSISSLTDGFTALISTTAKKLSGYLSPTPSESGGGVLPVHASKRSITLELQDVVVDVA